MPKGLKIKQKTERRISAVVRITLCAVLVLAQIVLTLLLTEYIHAKASFVYGALMALGAVMALWIYNRSGSPSYKFSWMSLLLLFPVAGLILFYFWGGTRQAKTLSMRRVPPPLERQPARERSRDNIRALRRENDNLALLASYLHNQGFLLYRDTDACYLPEGADFFQDLMDHLRRAETYIFMEYYILAEGEIWDRIFRILRERAAAGVEVKVIFDDFGNITRLSDATLLAMQDAGIEVAVFNPVHRYVNRIYFNYRDHRKITVIDGQWAYTGGINVGDEYANLVERFGYWKDTGVRLEGEGAWGLAALFIQMWKMMGRTMPNEDDYYRPRQSFAGQGWCQTLADGPLNNPDNPIEDSYHLLISAARRQVYITTPYYAVEEAMQKSLCIAAQCGVDVRLLVPAVPDKKYAYLVAETYWGELLKNGVRIYKYTPGFLHAKSVLVDGEAALVGSTNMDYRTFQLHYECGELLYYSPAVAELQADLEKVMEQSRPYTLEEWRRRPWHRRVIAGILKLFAIWL